MPESEVVKSMDENTVYKIIKEIKMNSGEALKLSVELVNVKERNFGTVKDFLETMLKEIKDLL